MAERPFCSGEHFRPVPAVARLTWPDKRWPEQIACKTCLKRLIAWYVVGDAGERHPVNLEPVPLDEDLQGGPVRPVAVLGPDGRDSGKMVWVGEFPGE